MPTYKVKKPIPRIFVDKKIYDITGKEVKIDRKLTKTELSRYKEYIGEIK